METLILRFPHLCEMIFDNLDNQSLFNCKVVSKVWSIYIGEQKFYGIRSIKETVKQFYKLSKPWFEVFKKANTENILELRNCFNQFQKEGRQIYNKFNKEVTPLHVCASAGNILLYEAIHKLAENKQPRTEDGFEPVFYSIKEGNVEMTEFIIQRSVDKNPESKDGSTALHLASKHGHVEICESIVKHLEDKNPKCIYTGTTPLHVAARFGHVRVSELIINHIDDQQRSIPFINLYDNLVDDEKNPRDVNGWTPLHYAAEFGHTKTSKMIIEAVQNKNPMSNWTRMTPFHIASKYGRVEICALFLKSIRDKHPRTSVGAVFAGDTPLHMAAENGHVKVCILILQSVRNKNPRNHDGKTPLTVARENNQFKVCWVLEKIWNCVT